ncbi:MAG: hypothetical protein P4M01_03565 [Acidobacteriota bacterium]|nr:hypothetical protein [Acidobacteriota bacterium]
MKSPAEMKVIQIDLTNACHKACSNCTRFCGEHTKPFYMPVETFKKAVDSMVGFPGIVGIMGGEPTLHPQFPEMVEYFAGKIQDPLAPSFVQSPTKNFQDYHRMVKYQRGRRRALFSSLGAGYYRNFEQIHDTFGYQNLNDHRAVNTHQAILVTRKELGIPDEEWYKLRDNCWIQNVWSATITPKGAFFCEIAGSLDMLFNGPGGWPIEPGWWKRKPSEFGDQLQWCEMCSVACKVPTMNADEETDIVSPFMLEKLKQVNGPKIRNNQFVVLDTDHYDAAKYEGHESDPIWYFPKDQRDKARVSSTDSTLFPHRIDVAVRQGESTQATLTREQVEKLEFSDWVAVFKDEKDINAEFLQNAAACILNPGCLYRLGDTVWLFNRRAMALKGAQEIKLDHALPGRRWQPRKRIALKSYPCIGELTAGERARLQVQEIWQRGTSALMGLVPGRNI